MREVESLLLLEALVVQAVGVGTIKAVVSCCEIVGDNALFYDVGVII